jgi:LAO/AO transport system kinase
VNPSRLRAIADGFRAGDVGALAQALSVVEKGGAPLADLLALLPDAGPVTPIVGITGPPGAGKSTLVDAMVRLLRAGRRTVGVLAVDPSSPFTRGAFLGDRVRLSGHSTDPGVFIRSMGARGHSGGLSLAAADAIWVLRSFGFDEVLVETVGVGQSELALRSVVDTVIVVVPPEAGDQIQMAKAGIMEIADVFVVNKGDLPGAGRTAADLRGSVRLRAAGQWRPRVVTTIATRPDDSHAALWQAVEQHRAHLAGAPTETGQAQDRTAEAVADMVAVAARAWVRDVLADDAVIRAALESGAAPYLVAQQICERLGLSRLDDNLDVPARRQ